MSRSIELTLRGLLLLALMAPWLNPFALGPSPAVVQSLVSWASLACLLLLAVLLGGRLRLSEVSALAWLCAALLSCLVALLQYFGASEHFWPWINGTAVGEAYANLRQRNQFATLTNIGAAALLWSASRGAARFDGRSAAAVLMALLLGVGNAASSSRTGLLQLGALALLAWPWGGWRAPATRRVLLGLLLAYVAAAVLLPGLLGMSPQSAGILARLRDGGPACASRLVLWNNVLHLIALRPLTGWGWGELDFAHFVTLYPGARFCDILDNAHNLPLHLAVELGIPVAVLVGVVALWLVWRAAPWREADPGRQLAWSVLAVIMLHSLLEYPLWYGPFQVAAGLSCVLLLTTRAQRAAHPADWMRGLLLAASGVLCVAVVYVAWDYHRISQIYMPPEERSAAYRDDTLEKIRASRLFNDQVVFAELTTTALSRENAAHVHDMALQMLHFSPEARVVERLIESANLLGRRDEALFYLARFRAAFPREADRWSAGLRPPTDREVPASGDTEAKD